MTGRFLLSAACVLAAAPAMAGPYINTELKSSWAGSDYSKSTWHNDLGFESKLSKSTKFYIQGGPAYSAVDAASSSDLEFSGKAGGAVAVSESVSVYGELSLVTAKENGYGAKGGIKYSF